MPDTNSPPSRINWLLIGFALGVMTAPFWGVLLGPDPGIHHPRLRKAKS